MSMTYTYMPYKHSLEPALSGAYTLPDADTLCREHQCSNSDANGSVSMPAGDDACRDSSSVRTQRTGSIECVLLLPDTLECVPLLQNA